MRIFLIIWVGQFTSILGSGMTNFAVTIWIWETTGLATPLTLIFFFTQASTVIAAVFGGVLVDYLPRKQVMFLGDLLAGVSTIVILLLFLTDHLEIWHIYFNGIINGFFSFLQGLAYSASTTLLVSKQHYARVNALNSIHRSGALIISPALAGGLYSLVGLVGILGIDVVTFMIAIVTLKVVHIPQPLKREVTRQNIQTIWQELTFGFRYVLRRPSLFAILIFRLIYNLTEGLNLAILPVMILSRSGNDSAVFGSIQTTFGIGALIGATTISIWGGPKRRIHGVFLGIAISRFCLILLSMAQGILLKIASAFTGGFFLAFDSSSLESIWFSKVEPDVQGRVFAARILVSRIPTSLGAACAGLFADSFFEPAMRPGGSLAGTFGGLFGDQTGSGMALMITLSAICSLLIVLAGCALPILRNIEDILPDHEGV